MLNSSSESELRTKDITNEEELYEQNLKGSSIMTNKIQANICECGNSAFLGKNPSKQVITKALQYFSTRNMEAGDKYILQKSIDGNFELSIETNDEIEAVVDCKVDIETALGSEESFDFVSGNFTDHGFVILFDHLDQRWVAEFSHLNLEGSERI